VILSVLQPLADSVRPALARMLARLSAELHGYGLEGLDRRLICAIAPDAQRGMGFFVELGANDGLTQSNTYLLQRRFGWTGLLIEPSQARYLDCIRNRSFGRRPSFRCAACVDSAFREPFVSMQYSDLMSVALDLDLTAESATRHAGRGRRFLSSPDHVHVFGAVARTLTSLLDEVAAPRRFDLLSLDVEGNELCVLRGLDLTRYQPRWILVEARDDQITDYLLARGYRLAEVLSDHGTYRDLLFAMP